MCLTPRKMGFNNFLRIATILGFKIHDLQKLDPDYVGYGFDPDLLNPDLVGVVPMKWPEFEGLCYDFLKLHPLFINAGILTMPGEEETGVKAIMTQTSFILNLQTMAREYREQNLKPTQAAIAAAAAVRANRKADLTQLRNDKTTSSQEISRLRDQLREVTIQNEHFTNEAENVDAILKKKAADGLMKSKDGLLIVFNSVTSTAREQAKMTAIKEREQATNEKTCAMTTLIIEKADTTEEVETYTNTVKDISAVLVNGLEVSRIEHTDASMNVDLSGVGDEDPLFQNNNVDERIDEVPSFQNERIVELTTRHEEAVKALTEKNEKLTIQLAESHAKGEKNCPLILSLQQKVEELEQEKTASAIKLGQEKTASAIELNTKDGTIADKASTIVTKDIEINRLESDKIALDETIRERNETVTGLNNRIIQLEGNHQNQITQLKGDHLNQITQLKRDRRNQVTLLKDMIDSVNKLNTKLEAAKRGLEKDLRKNNWNWIIAFIVVLSLLALLANHLFFSNDTVSSSKQASVEYPYENKYSGEEE